MIPFTLYVSHGRDPDYLYHFVDIIKKIPFFNGMKFGIDAWCYDFEMEKISYDSIDIPIWKAEYHRKPHGERCFELIEQAETDIVFIVDSDFFCCDPNLWVDSYNKLITSPEIYMASLYQQWNWVNDLPTTPFCAYTKKVLDYAPEKKLWNHFGKIWPEMKQPVFDHMKYVYLSLYMNGHTYCGGAINWPGAILKYKHYHFWDSRDFFEDNFANYEKDRNPTTTMFMVYGLCKCFFKCIMYNKLDISETIWGYVVDINNDPFHYGFVTNFFKYIEDQISFKPEWLERYYIIKREFMSRFIMQN